MPPTHEVFNQVPPLIGYDVADDPAMLDALRREGAGWAEPDVRSIGRRAGTQQAQDWGRLANEHPPVLHTHDRYGQRVDEVEFHPAWHELMNVAIGSGLHAAPWRTGRPGAHVARAAKLYLWGRTDAGHTCPVSMTYAIVPALRHAPELAQRFEPLLASTAYDPVLGPPEGKRGLIAGMSMTEKQGGSDVRANTTRAVPVPGDGPGSYRLTGHKWFTSAPMSDVFLVLAQAPGGLSCFLLPRVLPDGTRNGMHLQRLKDKLGNRSNASAEVEYDGAAAWPGTAIRPWPTRSPRPGSAGTGAARSARCRPAPTRAPSSSGSLRRPPHPDRFAPVHRAPPGASSTRRHTGHHWLWSAPDCRRPDWPRPSPKSAARAPTGSPPRMARSARSA